LDFLQQIASPTLEIFIEKGDVLGSVGVEITVANGLGLHLTKAIKIELSRKG
jgi:hypothetical protein